MILCISVLSLVISPFSFPILLIWFFSLCFLMSLANGLSILFILSKNQLLALLSFAMVSFVSFVFISALIFFVCLFFWNSLAFSFFFSNFILFFNFIILYWFWHISTWICHRYTRVPHPEPFSLLPPHTLPLGCPSATRKQRNEEPQG